MSLSASFLLHWSPCYNSLSPYRTENSQKSGSMADPLLYPEYLAQGPAQNTCSVRFTKWMDFFLGVIFQSHTQHGHSSCPRKALLIASEVCDHVPYPCGPKSSVSLLVLNLFVWVAGQVKPQHPLSISVVGSGEEVVAERGPLALPGESVEPEWEMGFRSPDSKGLTASLGWQRQKGMLFPPPLTPLCSDFLLPLWISKTRQWCKMQRRELKKNKTKKTKPSNCPIQMCEPILSIILTGSPTPSHPCSPVGHPGLWGIRIYHTWFSWLAPFSTCSYLPVPEEYTAWKPARMGVTAPWLWLGSCFTSLVVMITALPTSRGSIWTKIRCVKSVKR